MAWRGGVPPVRRHVILACDLPATSNTGYSHMRRSKSPPLAPLLATLATAPGAQAAETPPELMTRAEASGYRATSSYDETLDLLGRLAARSPWIRIDEFGTSEQGRPLPLVVVSKDKAFTPDAAHALGKPIVLLQSGIHAGEIDGKEATLMLLRELVSGQYPEILDTTTLLLVPIYNVDGHERVSRFNRSQQDGPEEGMGFRTNARGLDLNRDHLKLDSAEARALVGLVNAWRPQLHVDNHVSDGFDHAWVVGVATAEAPQAAAPVDAWARATLPAVAAATRRAGYPTGPYVELLSADDPAKGVITPPYRPRYSTGYFALRNRPSILIETHSHKPFRERVLGNHAWLVALLSEIARNPEALVEAVAAAERRTVELGRADAPPSDVVLRFGPDRDDPAADLGAPDRLRVPFYEWSTATSVVTGAPLTTYQRGKLHEIEVPWYHTPRVTLAIPRPRGYVLLPGWPTIEARLRGQGLRIEAIPAPMEAEVETIRVADPVFARAPYQGMTPVTAMKVTRSPERRRIPAGASWIPADQPDFEVAVQLLEPDAPDSLLAWGFLSGIFERKEWIDGPELERMASDLLENPQVAAEWRAALEDPAFANDEAARHEWWSKHTPYWDETIGLMPVYRLMNPLPKRQIPGAPRPGQAQASLP